MAVVLDLETKKDFREVGGRKKPELLGVSVIGIYDYDTDSYQVFEESQLAQIEEILAKSNLIIGFNIKGFDFLVLQPYLQKVNLKIVPALDIMEEAARYTGYRVSLDSLAQATLKESKTGDGLKALTFYKEGKLDDLKRYCLNDVRLTEEIYDFGCHNNYVLIKSLDGLLNHKIPVKWSSRPPLIFKDF